MNPETQEGFEKTVLSRPTKRAEESETSVIDTADISSTVIRPLSESHKLSAEQPQEYEQESAEIKEQKENSPSIDQTKVEILENKLSALNIPIAGARFYPIEPPFDPEELSLVDLAHEMDDIIRETENKRLPVDAGDPDAWKKARTELLEQLTEQGKHKEYLHSLSTANFLQLGHEIFQKGANRIRTEHAAEYLRRKKAGEFHDVDIGSTEPDVNEDIDPSLLENQPVVGLPPLTEQERKNIRKRSKRS